MTANGRGAADGRYTAVLDRFETTDPADGRDKGTESESTESESTESEGQELAVLLLESGDEVVAERAIPAWRLPEDARRQDAVLELTLQNGYVVSVTHDPEETERRTSEAQSRFDRLAERPGEESESDDETDEE